MIVERLRAAGCVYAEDEARLLLAAAPTPDDLASMVDRRVSGMPLEHVLGWVQFCGLRVAVGPGVFVPRRRTELVVRQAAALARTASPVVVDLCCGSGAVGLALASALGRAELYAVEIDPVAVRYARENLARVGGQVLAGDLYDPLPAGLRGRVDIVTANVPYVPSEEIELLPSEARTYEPSVSLDGGPDGLDVFRRVAAGAPEWLAPAGHLLVETSERQAEQAVAAFAGAGLVPRLARSAELGATVVVGTPRLRRGAPLG